MPEESATLCRVTVVAGGRGTDLVLPRHLAVRDVLPAVVDAVHRHPGAVAPAAGVHWQLARPADAPLDPAATLAGVADGEVLLLLTGTARPTAPVFDADCRALAAAAADGGPQITSAPRAARLGVAAAAALGTAATVTGGPETPPGLAAAPLATVALAALAGAVLLARRGARLDGAVVLGAGLVAAAGSGYVAVPGRGVPATVLAAAAVATVAALGSRLGAGPPVVCVAAASVAALGGGGALGALALDASPAGCGALVAALAVLTSATAPSLALRLAGVRVPSIAGGPVGAADPADAPRRAARAHRMLDGLAAGSLIAGAGGAVTAVLAQPGHADGASTVALASAVALALALRGRPRGTAVSDPAALAAAATVGASIVVATAPTAAVAPVLALASAAGLAATGALPRPTVTPPVRRAIDLLGHVAVAAVVPLAMWACGAVDAVLAWDLR